MLRRPGQTTRGVQQHVVRGSQLYATMWLMSQHAMVQKMDSASSAAASARVSAMASHDALILSACTR